MADLSGKTFGQYQLIEPISSGGMATIYKAYQPALDRVVAIKVLPEYLLAQAGFLERFKIEAQAIAKLDHPHILPVYDYGEAERTPYLVMKYVPGGTLKDLMAQGPLDARQTAQLLRQIAEALDHAHQQGIVHRDVKPSNVLLQDGHWALLMDFGLAKMLTSTSNITASGTGVGTPDYMSPEQAQGLAIDQRTDIYSLGIVLYQMLTGDVPFHAETPMAVMLKQIVETPSLPHLHNPSIRPAVDEVIMKAIAKSPADRYARATDLAGAYEIGARFGRDVAHRHDAVCPDVTACAHDRTATRPVADRGRDRHRLDRGDRRGRARPVHPIELGPLDGPTRRESAGRFQRRDDQSGDVAVSRHLHDHAR